MTFWALEETNNVIACLLARICAHAPRIAASEGQTFAFARYRTSSQPVSSPGVPMTPFPCCSCNGGITLRGARWSETVPQNSFGAYITTHDAVDEYFSTISPYRRYFRVCRSTNHDVPILLSRARLLLVAPNPHRHHERKEPTHTLRKQQRVLAHHILYLCQYNRQLRLRLRN